MPALLGAWLLAGAAHADAAPIVDDFKRLCMDTHAVPSAVYAAAEKSGWQNAPGAAEVFAKISGDPTGRIWNDADGRSRAVTAAARPLPNGVPDNRCFLLGPARLEETVAGVRGVLKLEPSKQTASTVTWNVSSLDGVLRRSEDYKPEDLFQPGKHGPALSINVVAISSGVAVTYRELGAERIIKPPPPLPADAGDVSHFKAWIEQGDHRQSLSGDIHLKKAPFVIVFEGSHVLSYSVAASIDPAALSDKTSEADLKDVFNPFGIGAEGERDHDLFVNPPKDGSPVALTVHSWSDNEAGHHRFESFVIDPHGVATAKRDIDEVMIAHGGPSIPIDHWDGRPIYLLVTARPPTADHPHEDPKSAVLIFQ